MIKRFIGYSFVFSIIWTSCQNSPSSISLVKINESDSLKVKFAPILNGDWVATSYFDSISISKSPYRSQNVLPGIVEFSIDLHNSIADSVLLGASGIHEGISPTLYFRKGKLETSLPINLYGEEKENFYELGYQTNNHNTTLLIYKYNRDGSLVSTIKYSKVRNHKEDAFQYQLNKMLFSGIYNVTDSSGKSFEVELTNDGVIKGLPNQNKYFVMADFVADEENAEDQLCFEIQTSKQVCYGYKINGDTLQLFDQVEDENKVFLKLGDKKYEFVRKK